jgi:hypothetical protein
LVELLFVKFSEATVKESEVTPKGAFTTLFSFCEKCDSGYGPSRLIQALAGAFMGQPRLEVVVPEDGIGGREHFAGGIHRPLKRLRVGVRRRQK